MATVKYVLTLDDKLSKGLKSTRENVQKTIAALHALNDAATGVASGMQTAGGSVAMSADQVRDASVAISEASKAAGLGAEQQAKLAEASKKAASAAMAQREATRKARAEAKAAAAAARAEAKERAGLARVLDQQRAADERVRLGKEQAQAVQELRIIDQTIAKLRERNELTEDELALLERRKAQVRENLAIESGRAAERGVRIDRGFGARGTRRSPIAGGVFSTQVDKATSSMKDARIAAQELGRQLPDVFAQLSSGADVSTVFTQQGLQVVQSVEAQTGAFTRFFGLLARSGPILAGIGVGVAALAAAYFSIENALDAANDAAGRLNERLEKGANRLKGYKEAARDANDVIAGFSKRARDAEVDAAAATGEITKQDAAFRKLETGIREQSDQARVALERQAEQARQNLKIAKDAGLARAEQQVTLNRATKEEIETVERAREAREALADAEKRLQNLDAQTDRIITAESTKLLTEVEKEREEERKKAAEAAAADRKKAAQEQERELASREQALQRLTRIARQAETSQLDGIDAVNAALTDQLGAIDAIVATQGRLTPQQQAAAARARGAVRGQAEAQKAEIRAKEQEEAQKAAADAATAAEDAAKSLQGLLDSLGAGIRRDGLGSLLTGDVSGAIEAGLGRAIALAGRGATAAGLEGLGAGAALAAGPLAAGTVALKEVGDLGAAGVEDLAEQTVEAIVAGIEALPEILVRVAPKIGVAIVTEIIPALALLPIEFAKAIGQALRELFAGGRERRADRRERRTDRRAARRAERGFRSGTSMVERDGLHFLHRGEAVVPTSGATTQTVLERVREQAGVAPAGPRVRPVTMEALILRVGQASTPYATFPGTPP